MTNSLLWIALILAFASGFAFGRVRINRNGGRW